MQKWRFLTNQLQDDQRIREEAAWALLGAVEELFPAKIDQLRELEERLRAAPDDDENPEEGFRIYDEVVREAQKWTSGNRIACPAVNAAALRLACGDIGPASGVSWTYIDRTYVDEHGREHVLPFIWTYPPDESKTEFLKRADAYYDEVVGLLKRPGDRHIPLKHDLEHFRWLVLRYVGQHSAADIARGVDDWKPSRHVTPITVAGEVRKLADWFGIERSKTPGPRRGSKHPRKRKRFRRA